MKESYRQFYNTVMEYYGEYGRYDRPWRKNQTAYRVAVSELMLQQTQAQRVVSFFTNWMKQFPSWKALAKAPQSEVLRAWKGLGYNSRALRLQKLAQEVHDNYKGRLPKDYDKLVALPGIGPYTAGAIRAFAFNMWTPLIETNIRRIYIHHFFNDRSDVSDTEIFEVIEDMGEVENPREWYEALMDYGASLPKLVKHNPNVKSKHYAKQSKFKGSDREIRGKILDILLSKQKVKISDLFEELGKEEERYARILDDLDKEGFLKLNKKTVTLK
jgi:A/G-specific adenine glycosylase